MEKRTSIDWQAALAALERVQVLLERRQYSRRDRERMLRERARLLALPTPLFSSAAERRQIMVFRLGEERFALMLSEVSELFRDARIAAVPGAPPEIAGVTQVRGEIYPVFEAAVLLGVARPEQDDTVVLVRHVQRQLGLRIGLVEDIRPLRAARDNEVPQDPRIRQYSEDLIQVVNLEYVLGQVGAK